MYSGPVIEVLYSNSCKETTHLVETIYDYFCFNTDDLFHQDAVGIPVYRYSYENNSTLPYNRKFVLLFIDDALMLNNILKTHCLNIIDSHSENVFIIPILLSDAGFPIVRKINSIVLYCIPDIEIQKNILLCEVTRLILQEMKNDPSKHRIFISYCRKDGREIADCFCNYINTKTHLATILDTTSIEVRKDFQSEIEKLMASSSVIFICTDEYSNRFWCLEEVLYSKKHDIPSIIVDAIIKGENRRFPYLGNAPTVKWKNEEITILEIINKILFVSLKQFMQQELSKSITSENSIYLYHYPELANFAFLSKDVKDIFYPDPPLGSSEKNFIEKYTQRNIYTPITYQCTNQRKHLNVCISLSTAEHCTRNCFPKQTTYIYLELLRYLIYSSYTVMYGGDWRNGGYTEYIFDLISAYHDNQELLQYKFKNYLAFPFNLNIDLHTEAKIKNIAEIIEIDTSSSVHNASDLLNDNAFIAYSLSKMRRAMISDCDAIVAIAGRKNTGHSIVSGVIEEIIIAKKLKKPIFIIGGLGGVCYEIGQAIKNHRAYAPLFADDVLSQYQRYDSAWKKDEYVHQLKELTYENLHNSLSEEENNILFNSSNPYDIIPLILKGLGNL